jgi:hypothetical protein
MGHPETIHLREAQGAPRGDARVIDVHFTEVGGVWRTLWGRIKAGLQAMLWAATIGFLIPPVWVLAQRIGDLLRPL